MKEKEGIDEIFTRNLNGAESDLSIHELESMSQNTIDAFLQSPVPEIPDPSGVASKSVVKQLVAKGFGSVNSVLVIVGSVTVAVVSTLVLSHAYEDSPSTLSEGHKIPILKEKKQDLLPVEIATDTMDSMVFQQDTVYERNKPTVKKKTISQEVFTKLKNSSERTKNKISTTSTPTTIDTLSTKIPVVDLQTEAKSIANAEKENKLQDSVVKKIVNKPVVIVQSDTVRIVDTIKVRERR